MPNGSLKPVLIPDREIRALTLPGWDTNPSQVNPSKYWYSFTYPGIMNSRINLGRKEGRTEIQTSAELGMLTMLQREKDKEKEKSILLFQQTIIT